MGFCIEDVSVDRGVGERIPGDALAKVLGSAGGII